MTVNHQVGISKLSASAAQSTVVCSVYYRVKHTVWITNNSLARLVDWYNGYHMFIWGTR